MEKERKASIVIDKLEDYERIENGNAIYYLGDIHVLNQPFYRIKVIKFAKVKRMLTFS